MRRNIAVQYCKHTLLFSRTGVFYVYGTKHMFSDELKKILIEVITSWQVITVTVVLVIYIFIVNNVARLYHRRRSSRPLMPQPIPEPPASGTPGGTAKPAAGASPDELNLEEEDSE